MAKRVAHGTGGESHAIRPGALTALLNEIAAAPAEARGAAWEGVLRPGAVVGRFELVRELGRGGFGVVWEARDVDLGRSVAFKAVRAGEQAEEREARLLEEAEAAARLQHPNIVTLHDVGRAEQGPYLVLELLRGRTLARRLEDGPLPVAEALRVAVEVARGLDHAHASGVVHRDLKPGNVFLCQGGQVKVLDFGLAHAFGRRRQEGGTPGYMAPEQMAGAPEDERTDVFALGVIVFEMLSGRLPFPDAKALFSSGLAPRLEVPELPALGDLVARMLAKDPVRRPRDGGSVLRELVAMADGGGRTGHAAVRVRRRLPRPAIAGLAAGLLAAVLGSAVLYRALEARWHAESRTSAAEPGAMPSIAVLPFADESPKQDQGYFADGIADEILDALAQVEGLRVAGRTSSFYFKGKEARLADIGRELRVAHVLEGSVRKSGPRVRVTAAVVHVADGSRLWAKTFDREVTDAFAVQDEIARAVAEALSVRLLPAPAAKGGATVSQEALDLVLRGRDLLRSGAVADAERAVGVYERALSLAPGFALAWVGLARALYWIESMGEATSVDRRRRALAAAERAVELAPGLPQAYVARGRIRRDLLLDWKGALADAERARALGPGDSETLAYYGVTLLALGRPPEAAREIERAAEIDPLWPAVWLNLGRARIASGDHVGGRAALKRALEISPGAGVGRYSLIAEWTAAGRPDEALALAQQAELPWVRLFGIALAQHDLGHARESQAALDELVARNAGVAAYQIAEVHAWRGERDPAFEWLERARVQRDPGISFLKCDQLFRNVRADRRFAEFLRKLDLPPD